MGLVLDPLAPEVRAGWRAWNAPFEGDVRTMYRDVRGFVTCAVGFLINSPQAATALRWSNNDGSPASTAAVVAEWHRVFSMPPALAWYAYAGGATVRLGDDENERITLQRIDEDAQSLLVSFPDLGSYPPEVQTALCSLAWAMGAWWPRTWPHLSASVRAQDWHACALNCAINAEGNPGVIPRNRAQAAAFEAAANGAPTLRPESIAPPVDTSGEAA